MAKIIEYAQIEVIPQEEDAANGSRVVDRMNRICASPLEQQLYRYNPNGARNNTNPGIPLEGYGTQVD